jgi:hypothetical protein
MTAVATKRTKVLDKATDYFNEPRQEVRQINKEFGGVFFHMAGKQFVLIIDLQTDAELFVAVIKNGYWVRI